MADKQAGRLAGLHTDLEQCEVPEDGGAEREGARLERRHRSGHRRRGLGALGRSWGRGRGREEGKETAEGDRVPGQRHGHRTADLSEGAGVGGEHANGSYQRRQGVLRGRACLPLLEAAEPSALARTSRSSSTHDARSEAEATRMALPAAEAAAAESELRDVAAAWSSPETKGRSLQPASALAWRK